MADRATVSQLTKTVAELTTELKFAQRKLVEQMEENAKLLKELASVKKGGAWTIRGTCPKVKTTKHQNTKPGPHYCWSCGFLTDHGSKECRQKKPGHQDKARAKEPMGGSMRNKSAWIKTTLGDLVE